MANRNRSFFLELVLIGGMIAAVIAAGFNGLNDYYNVRNDKHYSTATIVYQTLQLFTFQFALVDPKDPDGAPLGPALEFARFAAPLLSSYAVVRALMEIFAERLQAMRVSLLRGHVVVCGLSRKGFELVKDYRSRNVRVVLVEWDKENDLLENCRDLGAHLVMGDATEELTLHKAAAERARVLYAVCEEDGVNAEVALLAQSRVTKVVGKPLLDIFVHIENLKLCSLLRAHGMGEHKSAGSRFKIFNIHENAARHVLKTHPIDGKGIAFDDPRTVHVVLIGVGRMGAMLALHSIQMGHFANGKKLSLTVIDRQAKARSAPFLARHPEFGTICDAEFINDDYESKHVLELIERLAHDSTKLVSVFVCLHDDSTSLTCALRCAEIFKEHEIPILVRLDRDSGLAVLAEHHQVTAGARIRTFVVGGTFCSEKEIVEKDRTRLARAIHEDRRVNADAAHAVPHWHELDEEAHDFYRQAADHAPVKLRSIRCEIASAKNAESAFEFSPAEIESIARMEHRRWSASRMLAGYHFGQTPDGRKDARRRIHPMLVEWDALPEAERGLLRDSVVRIPQWLQSIGKAVKRRPANG